MNGVHDMGGMHGFGPIPREENEAVFHASWEGRMFGMLLNLGRHGVHEPGGLRAALENMEPAQYLAAVRLFGETMEQHLSDMLMDEHPEIAVLDSRETPTGPDGRAAALGSTPAMMNLGALYVDGRGVEKSPSDATGWFLKAAEHGDKFAQAKVGVAYHNGDGVTRDLVESYKWLSLSSSDRAKPWQKVVGAKLSKYELEKSRKRIEEWKKQHAPETTE